MGVVSGDVVFHGVTTGRSTFRHASLRFLNMVTQLSNLRSATFLASSSAEVYFGWNCFM